MDATARSCRRIFDVDVYGHNATCTLGYRDVCFTTPEHTAINLCLCVAANSYLVRTEHVYQYTSRLRFASSSFLKSNFLSQAVNQ